MSVMDMLSLLLVAGIVWIVLHIVQRRRAGSPMIDLSFSKNAAQIGIVLTIVAGIGAWSAISMDTSVATEVGRVNNLGLMASQQNRILLFGFLGVIGVLLVIFAKRR